MPPKLSNTPLASHPLFDAESSYLYCRLSEFTAEEELNLLSFPTNLSLLLNIILFFQAMLGLLALDTLPVPLTPLMDGVPLAVP